MKRNTEKGISTCSSKRRLSAEAQRALLSRSFSTVGPKPDLALLGSSQLLLLAQNYTALARVCPTSVYQKMSTSHGCSGCSTLNIKSKPRGCGHASADEERPCC